MIFFNIEERFEVGHQQLTELPGVYIAKEYRALQVGSKLMKNTQISRVWNN